MSSCSQGDKWINTWNDKVTTLEILCNTLQWWWWFLWNWFGVKKIQFQHSNYEGMGVPK